MPAAMSSSVLYSFTRSTRPSALLRSTLWCSPFSREPLQSINGTLLRKVPDISVRLPADIAWAQGIKESARCIDLLCSSDLFSTTVLRSNCHVLRSPTCRSTPSASKSLPVSPLRLQQHVSSNAATTACAQVDQHSVKGSVMKQPLLCRRVREWKYEHTVHVLLLIDLCLWVNAHRHGAHPVAIGCGGKPP